MKQLLNHDSHQSVHHTKFQSVIFDFSSTHWLINLVFEIKNLAVDQLLLMKVEDDYSGSKNSRAIRNGFLFITSVDSKDLLPNNDDP